MDIRFGKDHYGLIKAELGILLKSITPLMRPELVAEIKEYIESHGEYGLALESICNEVNEKSLQLSKEDQDRILLIASRMGYHEKFMNLPGESWTQPD